MKLVKATIEDIIEVKKLMDEVDSLKEKSLVINGYSENNGDKKLLIEKKESLITKNVLIIADLLKIDFDIVIDMCYDFDFARTVLS